MAAAGERGKLFGATLSLPCVAAVGHTTYTAWRAGRLHLTLRESARRDPSTPLAAKTLEFAAAVPGRAAIVVSFLGR